MITCPNCQGDFFSLNDICVTCDKKVPFYNFSLGDFSNSTLIPAYKTNRIYPFIPLESGNPQLFPSKLAPSPYPNVRLWDSVKYFWIYFDGQFGNVVQNLDIPEFRVGADRYKIGPNIRTSGKWKGSISGGANGLLDIKSFAGGEEGGDKKDRTVILVQKSCALPFSLIKSGKIELSLAPSQRSVRFKASGRPYSGIKLEDISGISYATLDIQVQPGDKPRVIKITDSNGSSRLITGNQSLPNDWSTPRWRPSRNSVHSSPIYQPNGKTYVVEFSPPSNSNAVVNIFYGVTCEVEWQGSFSGMWGDVLDNTVLTYR